MASRMHRTFWAAVVFGSVFGVVAVVVFVGVFRLIDPEPVHGEIDVLYPLQLSKSISLN